MLCCISSCVSFLCTAITAKNVAVAGSRHNGTPFLLKNKGVQYPLLCVGWCAAGLSRVADIFVVFSKAVCAQCLDSGEEDLDVSNLSDSITIK